MDLGWFGLDEAHMEVYKDESFKAQHGRTFPMLG
jgi:hypothetical protein